MGSRGEGAGPWLRGLRWVGGVLLRPRGLLTLLPPLAWAATIWLASAFSGNVTVRPAPWLKFLGNGVHALEFGVLALLCLPVIPRRRAFEQAPGGTPREWADLRPGAALGILLVVLIYAVTDELHQAHVPGRVTSMYDVLTDVVGAACVLSVVHLVGRQDATDRALGRRVLCCLLACCLAAGLSTYSDLTADESAPQSVNADS